MREAVILMAYGSPTNPDDIMEYLRDIYHGHEPPEYAVKENVEKYRMAGGVSPSNRIIESVRQKLEARLAREGDFRVMLGFKHWRPSIESAVREARDWGAGIIRAIMLFPFPSDNVEESYLEPLKASLSAVGYDGQIEFIDALDRAGDRFYDMWAEIVRPLVGGAHVLYDAHSLPLRESGEEAYVGHFRRSAERISEMLGLDRYLWGFQSIGRYGDRWLRPSVYDVTRDIREGEKVLAVPVGFVYTHLEVLYDLDYEFGGSLVARGVRYERTPLPDDRDSFIELLRSLATGGD